MVKAGLASPGDMNVPEFSGDNQIAVDIWNAMGGEIKFPDVLYLIAFNEVDDTALMLERLYAIRGAMRDG